MVLDILNGVPAIVIGIFVFGLLVVGRGQSGLAGAFALAVPDAAARRALDDGDARARAELAARGEPRARRRRSGARRSASCCRRRSAASSPARCSRSRASPARRRRCSSRPRSSARRRAGTRTTRSRRIPVAIFELSESPDPADHARAWAAALVLLLFILVREPRRRAGSPPAAAQDRCPLMEGARTRHVDYDRADDASRDPSQPDAAARAARADLPHRRASTRSTAASPRSRA